MANKNRTSTSVQSVGNACTILETIVELNGAGVTELAAELNLSKSSIHNHLKTLMEAGYISQEGSEYHIGLQCLTLGGYARNRYRLYQIARSAVDHLAEETDELALIATKHRGRSVYLYQTRGDKAVKTDSYPGIRLPLHCTGTGKAILAHMDQNDVEQIVEQHGLPKQTENTITDPEQLFEELEMIRNRRVSLDDEERILGMRGIASPIIERGSGDVVGALSITGPTSRLRETRFTEEIPELLRREAEMLEVNFMYS